MGVRVCCSDLSRMQAVTSGAPVFRVIYSTVLVQSEEKKDWRRS